MAETYAGELCGEPNGRGHLKGRISPSFSLGVVGTSLIAFLNTSFFVSRKTFCLNLTHCYQNESRSLSDNASQIWDKILFDIGGKHYLRG